MPRTHSVKLIDAATTTGAGSKHQPVEKDRTFQAVGETSAGSGAASIEIQGSLDGVNWITFATINLTLSTTPSTDGFASDAAWRWVRAEIVSISGTDATVTAWLGA